MSKDRSSGRASEQAPHGNALGKLSDAAFESLLPPRYRSVARVHWSPVSICRHAVRLLSPERGDRVLDIGSGVGKFCIAAAQINEAMFEGIELRAALVSAAAATAARLGVANVVFHQGEALDFDWTPFRALYFFNPFIEAFFSEEERIDQSIATGAPRFGECVERTALKLAEMPIGTRVAVYYGLGCAMPQSYYLVNEDWMGEGWLRLWLKLRS